MRIWDALFGRRPPVRLEELVLAGFRGSPPYAADLRLSPDGLRLLYLYTESATGEGDPWLLDLASGRKTPLADDDHWYWSPDWAPDGRSVLACSSRTGAGEVWSREVAPDARAEWRLLTRHGANCTLARWSPDGAAVAFLSSRDGPLDLWRLDRDGSTVRLTRGGLSSERGAGLGPRAAVSFDWSPDGRELAVSAVEREAPRRWRMEVRAVPATAIGPPRLLFLRHAETAEPCGLTRLSWSPDGGHLAFLRSVGAKYHLLVISRQGRRVTRKKFIGHLSARPWSPDGRRVAYGVEPGLAELADVRRSRTMALHAPDHESFREVCFLPDGAALLLRGPRLYRVNTLVPSARSAVLDCAQRPDATQDAVEAERRSRCAEEVERLRRALAGQEGAEGAESAESAEGVSLANTADPVLGALGHAALHEEAAARAAADRREARLPRLLAALTGADPVRRVGAVRVAAALAAAGARLPPDAAAPLLALAADGEREPPALRVQALDALHACAPTPGPVPEPRTSDAPAPAAGEIANRLLALEPLLADPSVPVARAAVRALACADAASAVDALARVRPRGVVGRVEFTADPGRRASTWDVVGEGWAHGDLLLLEAVRALEAIPSASATAALRDRLSAADASVRFRTLVALARRAALRAEELRAAAADPHPAIRCEAVARLAAAGLLPPASQPDLLFEGAATAVRTPADDERYWRLVLRGRVTHQGGPAATRLTVHTEAGGRATWVEVPRLVAGEYRTVELSLHLGVWDHPPTALPVRLECSEGLPVAFEVRVVH
ncbi:MAG: PD40 domain-containing protein [Planctomycetes bacterium]|nr:PD40 domain-containing protein [Planctomycetota bacterium]